MRELFIKAHTNMRHKDKTVYLSEVIEQPCATFHAYRKIGMGDSICDLDLALKREVGLAFDKTLREYFSGAFKGRWTSLDKVKVSEAVDCRVLGHLDDAYVFSVYDKLGLSLPGVAKTVGGFLANLVSPEQRSFAIVVDPDNCNWKTYQISLSDSDRSLYWAVFDDATYVEGVEWGLAPAEGIKSECLGCRFAEQCEVEEERKYEAQPFPLSGVNVSPAAYISEKLDKHLWSLNNLDDGRNTGFLSPSEMSISDCDRRMVYKLLKTPRRAEIPPNLRRVFDMGHAVHEVIQTAMHEADEAFKSEVTASVEGTMISGSCDGVLKIDKPGMGLEIKSISHGQFVKLKSPKKDHKKQANIYLAAENLQKMLFVYYDKQTGECALFYEPKSAEILNPILARAFKLEDLRAKIAENTGTLPEKKPGWGCGTCAYKYTCNPEANEERE